MAIQFNTVGIWATYDSSGIPVNVTCICFSVKLKPMILLVDDNQLQLATRRTILKQAGYSIISAQDPKEALDMIRDPEIGPQLRLIVTDHLMPGMRGDELVRELRVVQPMTPVLVITGHPDAETAYTDLDVQLQAKPCSPELLIQRIATLLGSPMSRTA
jgi:CheY-like chemotaxis protein